MKIITIDIYTKPFDGREAEYHYCFNARVKFADHRVIGVEATYDANQDPLGLIDYAVSNFMLEYKGKVLNANKESYMVFVPRSLIEQPGQAPAQQELPLEHKPDLTLRHGDMQIVADAAKKKVRDHIRDVVDEAVALNALVTPKPLKIEVGKYYKRRDGKAVGPVEAYWGLAIEYPFRTKGLPGDRYGFLTYAADGIWRINHESPFDLIEEVPAPGTQPQVESTTTDSARAPLQDNSPVEVPPTAVDYLNRAAAIMEERGRQYDQPGGERSMGKCVLAFNTITGHELTEAEGWLLLQILKDVRQWQRPGFHKDSAEDCIAYSALKAEAKQKEAR